jgi:hypothetical protein
LVVSELEREMIRYRLNCQNEHEFEAWFSSGESFDAQLKHQLVTCPECGSASVQKALMAPSVVTSEKKSAKRQRGSAKRDTDDQAEGNSPQLMSNGPQTEMLRQLRAMRDKILAEAEYVGPRFAEEARKIYHEEAPARGIYGEASAKDVRDLAEEGVDVFPVPVLPDDKN